MKKRTAIIENEYGISLGTNYFIDNPLLGKDWLYLILFFDELLLILPGLEYEKYKLITINAFPLEVINLKFPQNTIYEKDTLNLNIVYYCMEKGIMYINPIHYTERDEYLFNIEKKLPESLPFLKNSFLTIDILHFFMSNYISDIGKKYDRDLLFELANFKNGDLGKAFKDGIDYLTERYSPNYYLTPFVEEDIKNFFLHTQNELLKKTNIEKIKTFDFSKLMEDGASVVGSLIIQILPIGTIKEIFEYLRNSKDFKKSRFLLFVLSFFYIQKLISKYTKDESSDARCNICSLTVSEIDKMTEDQADKFIFKNSLMFCHTHLMSYLSNRKFKRLTGKALLINLKKEG